MNNRPRVHQAKQDPPGHWGPLWIPVSTRDTGSTMEHHDPPGVPGFTRDRGAHQDSGIHQGYLVSPRQKGPLRTLGSSGNSGFFQGHQVSKSTTDTWTTWTLGSSRNIVIHLGHWFLQGKLGLPRTPGSSRKSGFHQKHLDSEGNLSALGTLKSPLGL